MSAESVALTLRAAAPNDVPSVVALERELFTDPWSWASFADLLQHPAARFLVATAGDSLAAYAVVYVAVDEAELANLAVAPSWQRRGVGRRVLDDLLETLRHDGVVEVWLEVRTSNVAARRLYAGAGFSEVGRRRRYYDRPVEDAIVMRRSTAPR
ncbi:MAG: ribosomal protein S18-alanine N-acetyltransferase [Gemmatimonadaceae bacterium]|nr:ribosomal protein S18-alanine N-acetyltransferase [Gemmatimonadaceae bacterium]